MAVKIHCNACEKYIRDALPREISQLKGTEICKACEKRYEIAFGVIDRVSKEMPLKVNKLLDDAFKDVDKKARRCVVEIENMASLAKAEMEDCMKRVITRGEDDDTASRNVGTENSNQKG